MRTDRIFSPSRFSRLCRKTFIEQRRPMLLTALSFTAVFMTVSLLTGLMNSGITHYGFHDTYIPLPLETGWFVVIFFVWGMFVASATFKSLGKPQTALGTLTCPASQFEKFLMRWLAAVPLFILWALASAIFSDICRVLMTRYILWSPAEYVDWWEILKGEPGRMGLPDNMLWRLLGIFLPLQSFFLLGAVVWNSHHFFKTFVSLWAIGIVYSTTGFILYVNYFLETHQIPAGVHTDTDWPISLFFTAATLFNYALAYMRFREAEIINRW